MSKHKNTGYPNVLIFLCLTLYTYTFSLLCTQVTYYLMKCLGLSKQC